MPMKLYAHPNHYKTHATLIAATYVNLEIETPSSTAEPSTVGKIAVLETEQGCIFSSTAIARYVSRMNRAVGLYGQNNLEGGMIDSWLEFCTHEVEVPLCTWVLPVMGVMEEVPEATAVAKEDVQKSLSVLDKHLLHNTYMVGHQITLADIAVCCALVDGMRLVLDAEFRKPYANLVRWFTLCTQQPEFVKILGEPVLCGGSASSSGPAKKDSKEAAPKKEANKKGQKEDKTGKEAAPEKEAKKGQKEALPKKEPSKKEPSPKKVAKHQMGGGKEAASAEPAQPSAEDEEKARKDKLKKVIKEGGKRGVEIEGAADMGGLQFFCCAVDLPEGSEELLLESMKAMNAKSDPGEEERKGGSGHIGKMIFSAGTEQLAVAAYVPEDKQEQLSCEEWLKAVLDSQGGEVHSSAKDLCVGAVKADADKGIFPLKIREPMIVQANDFLRKRGLFPEDNDEDDDEMVFGDDDFPS